MDLNQLKTDIKLAEGFESSAYMDQSGLWTIGWGRLIDKKMGAGITRQEAEVLLDNDIQNCINDLDDHFPWFRKMSDARQRALIEMRYNLGMTRLTGFVNMLTDMENMDYKKASDEAMNSRWAKQVPARAARLAEMIRKG